MNIKTTLFLLAVLVGVAVYFLLFEKGRTGPDGPGAEPGERPLFTADEFDPSGVRKVHIRWDGNEAELARDEDGQWTQTQPVRFPLNTVRVSGIMNDAARLNYIEKFIPGEAGNPSIAHCGLDKPRATIRFTGVSTETRIDGETGNPTTSTTPFDQSVRIGGGLTGSRGYVQLNDDPHVYVVNNKLHNILLHENVAHWRQRSLEVPSDAQADTIVWSVEGRTIELRKTNGDWYFAPPMNDRAAPKAPAALLGLLKSAQVGVFVTESPSNLAVYGLDKPSVEVTVRTSAIEPRRRTLRIGNAADPAGLTYHATWSLGDEPSPVVFTVMGDVRGRFMAPRADELRDPRVSLAKTGGLREVTIKLGDGGAVRLQKAPATGWSFAPEGGQPAPPYKADQEAVGQLLDAITGAKAKYFHPKAVRPPDPLATIELGAAVGKEDERLVFYEPPVEARPRGDETPMVMVLRNSETTGYLVPESALRLVFEPTVRLRDRQIVDVKPEQIAGVTLKRFDGVTYEFKKFVSPIDTTGTPQWQMVGAETFERDGLNGLLKHVASLRAYTWLAEGAKLGERTVELTLVTAGGQQRVITTDLDTGYSKVAGGEGLFLAAAETRFYLDAEYRPRTVLDLVPGEVAQVTITKGDAKPWTIGKDEFGRYNVLGPDGKPVTTVKVNAESAARLFDALTPLRVWRHVEKPADAGEAATTIEAVTRGAKKHTLQTGFKDHPTLATMNDRWFTLAPASLAALNAEPMKQDEKGKE